MHSILESSSSSSGSSMRKTLSTSRGTTAAPDPNSVEAVAAVKQLVLSQIDKKLKDLREGELMYVVITTLLLIH